ncbi:hypothetical protein BV509_18535 [Rhodovulum sulfidophilum]|uniref:N-acetyltransferase domain-containing protein n=1 Tax=Rhodovulum visakhapatnamense TaxID=364297 RepID=A0ABS1RKY3_9RHOB|nr:hypothetical protein [Rhodovulum visakhapatnamense]MBL3571881.1 hypothetical protein [Rhodovulum visakhapatnamense]MBL3580303.1 hypothetical protein [Rhodovulum visakhapatnamense]OLS46152.1 hypothetical protein BV509_18535 [Rhodovulum sulfidophilum]
MAFVPAITSRDEVASYINLRNDTEFLARICIGHDDETNAIYSAFVSLCRQSGHTERYEIRFDVIETSACEDEPDNWCNDGLQTKRFLAADHRKTTLNCICTVLQEMVEASEAQELFMMTVTPHLPEKALAKYELICCALRAIGFHAGRDAPYHGTQIWIMKRISDGT